MRVGLQQRVVAKYRAEFFETLAARFDGNLSVYGGEPRKGEALEAVEELHMASFVRGRNLHLFRGVFYICVQFGLLKWLRRLDPDALILSGNPRLLMNWFAAGWMRRRGRTVLAWGLWAPKNMKIPNRVLRWIMRAYASRYDGFIMYSTKDAKECERIGLPASRIFVAPNAVTPAPPAWPARPPIGDRITILFVGRLQSRKRVDLLIEACARVHPQPELWIVGEGPARRSLEELASKRHPRSRFYGALFGADLADVFHSADLFVLPGTGGLAVQQAMFYGMPVVVAEADGTQTDLVTPNNGWLLRPGDLDGLVMIIKTAADDPAVLLRMGLESSRLVRTQVNLDIMTDRFLEALGAQGS